MSATASAVCPNSVHLWNDAVIHFVARTPPGRRQEEAAGVPRAHSEARERPFRARFAPTSDVRSTATASPGGKGDKGLARKRVFISFDYDNDRDLPGNLVAQARESASPFAFVDLSVKEPIDTKWRQEVRKKIRKCDFVIVMCGRHTHQAPGVAAELAIAREVGTPYFLLHGRSGKTCTRPKNALRDDSIHPWKWARLEKLFANAGRT